MEKILSTFCLSALVFLANNSFASEIINSDNRYVSVGFVSEDLFEDKNMEISLGFLKEYYGPLKIGSEVSGSLSKSIFPNVYEEISSKKYGGSLVLKSRLSLHSKVFFDAGIGYGFSIFNQYSEFLNKRGARYALAQFGFGYKINDNIGAIVSCGFNFINQSISSDSGFTQLELEEKDFKPKLGIMFTRSLS